MVFLKKHSLAEKTARSGRGSPARGFTLIELILVMIILTIVAGAVAPMLRGFTIGRRVANTARTMLALSQYARTQSMSEGRVYRLNFDTNGGSFWLTVDNAGTFDPPTNDFGNPQKLDSGIKMKVDIAATVVPLDEQQTGAAATPAPLPSDQFVEFDPSGRTQQVTVTLIDQFGATVQLACASATDQMRIVPSGEAAQ
jgi:type II secretion system protein H